MELGSVYLIETEDRSLVKIGFTARLSMRYRQIQRLSESWLRTDVRLIGFFPAPQSVETELHRRFAAFRVHGDWYRRDPVLREFAGALPLGAAPTIGGSCDSGLDPAAVALAKRRALKLTPERRSEIAAEGARAKWAKNGTTRPTRN